MKLFGKKKKEADNKKQGRSSFFKKGKRQEEPKAEIKYDPPNDANRNDDDDDDLLPTAHYSHSSLDELDRVMDDLDRVNPFATNNASIPAADENENEIENENETNHDDDYEYDNGASERMEPNNNSNAYSVDDSDNDDDDDYTEQVQQSPAAAALERILDQLTEQDYKEWTETAKDSHQAQLTSFSADEIQNFFRATVDSMDLEPLDVLVQRIGTRIVIKLTNLLEKQHKQENHCPSETTTSSTPADCWYHDDDDDLDRPIQSPKNAQPQHHQWTEDEMELVTDSVDAILQAMEDFPDDEVLVEDASLALEGLTKAPNASTTTKATTIFDTNTTKRILEEILVAMEGFADNPIVVSSSLGVLGNLSKPSHDHDELRRKLARYALPSILHGMKEHRDNLELYTKGCKAMANFTKDNPSAQQLLACKETLGLRIVSEGLHSSSKQQQQYNYNNASDEQIILQNLRLRSSALTVLKHLSTHPSLEVKGKIALGGGAARIMDRLLQVLQQTSKDLIANNYQVDCHWEQQPEDEHDEDDDDDDEVGISVSILRDALQILTHLANIESVVTKDDPRSPHMPRTSGYTNTNNTAEDLEKQLQKAVKPVLNVVRHHPNRWAIQYHGLDCIHKLTISHADSISNNGGLSTLLNALSGKRADPTRTRLFEKTLACLAGLLSPSSNADGLELVSLLDTEEGLASIFRIVRQYQSQPRVILLAFEALFFVSCRVRVVLASITSSHQFSHGAQASRKLSDELCLEENIFVLLGTMNQYLENPTQGPAICQKGLGVLVNIQAFLQVRENQRREREKEEQFHQQTQLTQQQQQQQQQTHDVLASYGAIKRVLAVMRRHGLAVAIQEYGVGLLGGILQNGKDSACKELFEEEGISTVISAMMIHPDHLAIQIGGCNILHQMVTVHHHNPYNLLEDDSQQVARANFYKKCIVQDTDAESLVRSALDRFPTQKRLQHRGTLLLRALTTPINARRSASAAAASISTALHSSILSSRSSILSSTTTMR